MTKLTDQAYQELLQHYEDDSAVIYENYTSVTNAMANLQSTDPKMQRNALAEFNDLLSIDNAQLVAEAMARIQATLVGDPKVGYHGLLEDDNIYYFLCPSIRLVLVLDTRAQFIANSKNDFSIIMLSPTSRSPALGLSCFSKFVSLYAKCRTSVPFEECLITQ